MHIWAYYSFNILINIPFKGFGSVIFSLIFLLSKGTLNLPNITVKIMFSTLIIIKKILITKSAY